MRTASFALGNTSRIFSTPNAITRERSSDETNVSAQDMATLSNYGESNNFSDREQAHFCHPLQPPMRLASLSSLTG